MLPSYQLFVTFLPAFCWSFVSLLSASFYFTIWKFFFVIWNREEKFIGKYIIYTVFLAYATDSCFIRKWKNNKVIMVISPLGIVELYHRDQTMASFIVIKDTYYVTSRGWFIKDDRTGQRSLLCPHRQRQWYQYQHSTSSLKWSTYAHTIHELRDIISTRSVHAIQSHNFTSISSGYLILSLCKRYNCKPSAFTTYVPCHKM